jgi:phosphoglycerol transferase MdoB-like AlkP superfamily enzyme
MASHMSTDAPSRTSTADLTGFTGFNLPHELEPMGTWAYVGLTILYAVPVIGWIFLVVFSVSGKNLNRRNFSRSVLFFDLVALAAYVVCVVLGVAQLPTDALEAAGAASLLQGLPL